MDQAVTFINEVRVSFLQYNYQNNTSEEVYNQFIKTLKKHETQAISMETMNKTIEDLL